MVTSASGTRVRARYAERPRSGSVLDSDRQSQKVRKDLREKLAAAQQTRTHKQQKIDEFLEELNAGPPQWAVQRGPARVEKWRRDQEQRIKRYEGELQSVNAKRADLEKTRIVFLALKDYYGKRHGDEKKFRDLLAAGYDNPIGVVAHFWLRESTEVRKGVVRVLKRRVLGEECALRKMH